MYEMPILGFALRTGRRSSSKLSNLQLVGLSSRCLKEHEFRSKVEVDKFLAGPRVKKALLEIEGADDTLVAFLMANEAAIKAAYAIASPEAKKRVISEETREKMREAMKARIASGAITPIAKKVDVETAAVSE